MDQPQRPTPHDPDPADGHNFYTWDVEYPDPTTLAFLWQDDQQPTFTEVHSMLATADLPLEPIDELDDDTDEVVWNRVLSRAPRGMKNADAARVAPIILWCEPAHPIPPEEMDHLGIVEAKWAIGFETMLDFSQPLEDFAAVIRLIARGLADSPAMLDVNTGRWYTREELEETFLKLGVLPPADLLWITHAISNDDFAGVDDLSEDDDTTGSVWLHTHGLRRCGAPELEMIDVPHRLSHPAGMLLHNLAESVLEDPLPGPGEPFAIGQELVVTVQPWEEIVETLSDDIAGVMKDRPEDDPQHRGLRAVVCGETPRGQFRKVWTYPREVLKRLNSEDVILYRSKLATERLSALASATWPEFAMAFLDFQKLCNAHAESITERDHPAIFIVKAGFRYQPTDPSVEANFEHVWLRVDDIEGDQAHCTLMNSPVYLGEMKEGDAISISREQMSEWSVFTPFGRFDPARTTGMRETLRSLFE